jgi:hypothetical protein
MRQAGRAKRARSGWAVQEIFTVSSMSRGRELHEEIGEAVQRHVVPFEPLALLRRGPWSSVTSRKRRAAVSACGARPRVSADVVCLEERRRCAGALHPKPREAVIELLHVGGGQLDA